MTQLVCKIVHYEWPHNYETPCYTYQVSDQGKVIAEGVSSSPAWVVHDAGSSKYHTALFNGLYPDGWQIEFDFGTFAPQHTAPTGGK